MSERAANARAGASSSAGASASASTSASASAVQRPQAQTKSSVLEQFVRECERLREDRRVLQLHMESQAEQLSAVRAELEQLRGDVARLSDAMTSRVREAVGAVTNIVPSLTTTMLLNKSAVKRMLPTLAAAGSALGGGPAGSTSSSSNSGSDGGGGGGASKRVALVGVDGHALVVRSGGADDAASSALEQQRQQMQQGDVSQRDGAVDGGNGDDDGDGDGDVDGDGGNRHNDHGVDGRRIAHLRQGGAGAHESAAAAASTAAGLQASSSAHLMIVPACAFFESGLRASGGAVDAAPPPPSRSDTRRGRPAVVRRTVPTATGRVLLDALAANPDLAARVTRWRKDKTGERQAFLVRESLHRALPEFEAGVVAQVCAEAETPPHEHASAIVSSLGDLLRNHPLKWILSKSGSDQWHGVWERLRLPADSVGDLAHALLLRSDQHARAYPEANV